MIPALHTDTMPGAALQENNIQDSSIGEFFRNRSIFITGGTGFIGKAVIEKLLRSFPSLKSIYILVRPKKCHSPPQRLYQLLEDPLFDLIRSSNPCYVSKLVLIEGDISLPGLGLSSDDYLKLIDGVSIVIHAAAAISFNDPLRKAVNINYSGTKRVVDLCKVMKQLKVLVHVSTAYANCHLSTVDEIVYPLETDVNELCEHLTKTSGADAVNKISESLEGRPNTYTFTKAMAECALLEEARTIPIVIVRPSIVTGIWKEPLVGWTSGVSGISGIPALWGRGILRTLRIDGEKVGDLIPVDVVVNLCIAAAWEIGTSKNKNLRVYNCCSGDQNPLTWNTLRDIFNASFVKNPFHNSFNFPYASYTSNTATQNVADMFKHRLPAVLVDCGSTLMGKKRTALHFYHQFTSYMTAFSYFQTREWNFDTSQTRALFGKLSTIDKATFNFEIQDLDWNEYLESYALGVRRYILKQKDDTIPESRKQIWKLYNVRAISKILSRL